MTDNTRAINRIFTRKVMDDLLTKGRSQIFDYVVQRYVNDSSRKNHRQIISKIYSYLGKEQRNEYYYMNTLINQLLVKAHDVKKTTALTQVRVEQHIADFVMLNGDGYIYEIKSDLDNFDRLYEQFRDYYKAFSNVSVLTSIRELDRVKSILEGFGDFGSSVGIYVLSNKDCMAEPLSQIRPPRKLNDYLQHNSIFKILRKAEYEQIIYNMFGKIPDVAPVFQFKVCLEKFREIPILEAQRQAFLELKKRNKITKTVFKKIPRELRSVMYFSGLFQKMPQLEQFLQTPYQE
jgi:hypothetical protein